MSTLTYTPATVTLLGLVVLHQMRTVLRQPLKNSQSQHGRRREVVRGLHGLVATHLSDDTRFEPVGHSVSR